jgi:hypothetical protein
VINLDDIRSRWQLVAPFLDERGRRLFAANEALALGFGGVTATALATGIARSTISPSSRIRGFFGVPLIVYQCVGGKSLHYIR